MKLGGLLLDASGKISGGKGRSRGSQERRVPQIFRLPCLKCLRSRDLLIGVSTLSSSIAFKRGIRQISQDRGVGALLLPLPDSQPLGRFASSASFRGLGGRTAGWSWGRRPLPGSSAGSLRPPPLHVGRLRQALLVPPFTITCPRRLGPLRGQPSRPFSDLILYPPPAATPSRSVPGRVPHSLNTLLFTRGQHLCSF